MSDWKKNAAKRRVEKQLEATGNKRNKKKQKKPWILQYRLTEPDKIPEFWRSLVKNSRFEWANSKKYAKKPDAIKALNSAQKSRPHTMFGSSVEYRIINKNEKDDDNHDKKCK